MEWLLDAWTIPDGVRLCLTDGKRPRYVDAKNLVTFYVSTAHPGRLERLLDEAEGVMVEHGTVTTLFGEERDVLAVTVPPLRARRAARAVEYWMGGEPELFNADVDPVQEFMLRRGLFPLCSIDGSLRTRDDPWDMEIDLPPLRIMRVDAPVGWRWRGVEPLDIRCYGTGDLFEREPGGGAKGRYPVRYDPAGDGYAPRKDIFYGGAGNGPGVGALPGTESMDVEDLTAAMDEYDPDVLIVPEGDEVLPAIVAAADQRAIGIRLDRLPGRKGRPEARVLHSYGRPVFRAGPWTLRGRIHVPGGFMFIEAGLEGVVELARIAHVSVQRAARTSPGTVISAMQVNHMLRSGIPVPWHKNAPEAIKTFRELTIADRGGFIFTPRPGVYRDVHELDFAAMYPSIMVQHNISPETLFSEDEPCHVVPELGYRIAEEPRGIIPAVLAPLIERRVALKARGDDASLRRAGALKWLLVTCFGYTGYRNAKLGRIEAHESINAYGREYMLRATETAREMGFEVVHGIVDSLWVTGERDVQELVERINHATGLRIEHESTFSWIVFLPVRSGMRGALNRYYGLQNDGEVKVRGVALRRRDAAPIVAAAQGEALDLVDDLVEERSNIEHVLAPFVAARDRLRAGRIRHGELAIRRLVSMEREDYSRPTPSSMALDLLAERGVVLHPGQYVKYVLGPDGDVVLPGEDGGRYGPEPYVKLLADAAVEILRPFADEDEIRSIVTGVRYGEREGPLWEASGPM